MVDKILVAEQIRLREAGFTVQQVADKAGVSLATMSRRLSMWGVRPLEPVVHMRRSRPRKLDGHEEEVRSMHWDECLSTRQIAERLGVSSSAVSAFMRAREIEIRPQAEAISLRHRVAPPVVARHSGQFTSETARMAINGYWTRRRVVDSRNARRRALRAARSERREVAA